MNAPTPIKNLLPASGIQQGTDIVHESAHLHVTGGATYIDDIPEVAGTLYAALIKSPVAHGELIGEGIDRAAILKEHGVVAVFTAKDIPGENNCGPIVHDDPFLADGKVEFVGQAVAVVVAREMLYAREAAAKAKVLVKELQPILTIEEALEAQSFVMPAKGIVPAMPRPPLPLHRARSRARPAPASRSSFIWKARLRMLCPRKTASSRCTARPSTRTATSAKPLLL